MLHVKPVINAAATEQFREEMRAAGERGAVSPAPVDRFATMRAVRAGLDRMIAEDGAKGEVLIALVSAAATAAMALEEIDLCRPSRRGGGSMMEQVDQVADAAPMLPAPMPGRSVLQQLSRREIEALDSDVRLQLEENHRQTIAAAEAERGKRRAEIAAAVALQPIEPDPEENLHPELVRSLEAQAAAAFGSARAVVGVALDAERTTMRAAGGGRAGYAAALRAYAVRWKAVAALASEDAALLAGAMPQTPQPLTDPTSKLVAARSAAGITAPGFNARALIAQLAGRGITLAVRDGDLRASPAGMLDEVARQQLRQHRAAVIEALSSSEKL